MCTSPTSRRWRGSSPGIRCAMPRPTQELRPPLAALRRRGRARPGEGRWRTRVEARSARSAGWLDLVAAITSANLHGFFRRLQRRHGGPAGDEQFSRFFGSFEPSNEILEIGPLPERGEVRNPLRPIWCLPAPPREPWPEHPCASAIAGSRPPLCWHPSQTDRRLLLRAPAGKNQKVVGRFLGR